MIEKSKIFESIFLLQKNIFYYRTFSFVAVKFKNEFFFPCVERKICLDCAKKMILQKIKVGHI
jgi:hypothetical protein